LAPLASTVSSRGYIRLVIQLSVRLLPISGLKLTTSVVVATVSTASLVLPSDLLGALGLQAAIVAATVRAASAVNGVRTRI
jgi:hypothetical protein